MLVRDPSHFPDQDRFGKADNPAGQRGNCKQACLAAILGMPLSEVPHFVDSEEDYEAQNRTMQLWLAERGWVSVWVPWNWIGTEWLDTPANSLVIISGKSPRGDWGHVVVGRLEGINWHLVHDPHPSKTGLDGAPHGIYLIAPMPHLKTL